MKDSKVVTPTLLFLMVILLCIAVYYNFLYIPLESKTDSISFENEYLKNQRLEIELAKVNKETIREDIENMKAALGSMKESKLIVGKVLADDINVNAKAYNLNIVNITIYDPVIAGGTAAGEKALLSIPADINFFANYENGARFIGSFENSEIGAYQMNSLNVQESENGYLNWEVSLSLYYYGDPEEAQESSTEEIPETNNGEGKEWTQ